MRTLARTGTAAVILTYLHLVFGGVVRITGSGMGCGDHWPKCNGSWIPPFTDPLVAIEWTHRLLALLVMLAITALALVAWRKRAEAGVSGEGGVTRPAAVALGLVVAVALLGMVTVKLGNSTFATLAHWTLAMALLAVLVVATIRAGGLGGASAAAQGGSARTVRWCSAGWWPSIPEPPLRARPFRFAGTDRRTCLQPRRTSSSRTASLRICCSSTCSRSPQPSGGAPVSRLP
jgi:heme A synthase